MHGCFLTRSFGRAFFEVGRVEGDDAGLEAGVGGQDAVVAVAVDARWRDQGLAYALALTESRSLVALLLGAYGVIDQLAPPVYAALFWRRATTADALSGLLVGMLTTVFFFLNPEMRPYDIHEGILGLMVNVAVLVTVSLLTRPQDPEHAEAFVRPVGASSTVPAGGAGRGSAPAAAEARTP